MTDFFIPVKTRKDLWYKEPWMLLVLGGPFIVVIAGFITLYLAAHGSDNVLTRDYYKQGLDINKSIEQDAKAREYKLQGTLQFDAAASRLSLHLQGATQFPDTLQLSIHANSSSSEFEALQKSVLTQVAPGTFTGNIGNKLPLHTNVWYIRIQAADWRLTADWHDPLHQALELTPQN